MVRSKPFIAVAGRKQRIEGIVKNLSEKIQTKEESALANGNPQQVNPLSVFFPGFQRRMEPHWPTTTTNRPNELVYNLPQGLEFSGVVSSSPLFKGRRFGPFFGKITPGTEHFRFDHTLVSQIPDLDGNPYSLHLLTSTMSSCVWLKCLHKCSLQGVYNIVAYNTPRGVVLEVVTEAGRGAELCVAYDQSYDVTEGSFMANEVIEIPSREPTPEKHVEPNIGVVDKRRLLTRSEECFPFPSTSSVHNEPGLLAVDGTVPEENEFPYSVMTAEITEPVAVKNEEKKKPAVNTEKKVTNSSGSNLNLTRVNEYEKDKKEPLGRMYRCHYCKNQFASQEEKQHHLDTYHSQECPVCQKAYSSSYLKEHMMFHLEASRLTCPVCSKVFSSVSNLRKHQKKHTKRNCGTATRKPINSFQCSECPQKYKSQKQLEIHRKKHVRVVPITCGECNETFTHKNLLRKHQAVVHRGKKPYSCKFCHQTFTQSGNLARHCRRFHSAVKVVRDQTPKKRYFCRRRGCDQSFASRDTFLKHLEQHSGSGGIFPCKECNGVFSSASNLCKHIKTLHSKKVITPPVVSTKFSCNMCKQSFQSEYVYKKHVRTHKANKNETKCEDCGKFFASRSGLSKHIRLRRCSATKERKPVKPQKTHGCKICGKSFFNVSELKTHRRSHVLDDQHVCDVCGKSFSQRGNLGKHKRHVHEGIPRPRDKPREKKLTCETCDKTFKTFTAMEVHTRMHMLEKPLKCAYCERRFSNMGGRKKHMMSCRRQKPSGSTSRSSENADKKPLMKTEKMPIKTVKPPTKTEKPPTRTEQSSTDAGELTNNSDLPESSIVPKERSFGTPISVRRTQNSLQILCPESIEQIMGNAEYHPEDAEQFTGNTEHAPENTEQFTRNIEHPPENTEQLTGNTEDLTENTEQVTVNTEHAPENTELVTGNSEHLPENTEQVTEQCGDALVGSSREESTEPTSPVF